VKVRLLRQHVINDRLYEPDSIVDVFSATPYMEGLDETARAVIKQEKIRVFGRWVGDPRNPHLLDDPPIERPLEENQPVPRIPAGKI
jgi:hypothetical protein